MKKMTLFALCFVAMGSFLAFQCGDYNPAPAISSLIVGTWQVDNVLINGESATPENLLLVMNEDGTGLLSNNGVTENNGYTWSVEGNTLTINEQHGTHVYTVHAINEDECTFSGETVPGQSQLIGKVVIHVVRVR